MRILIAQGDSAVAEKIKCNLMADPCFLATSSKEK